MNYISWPYEEQLLLQVLSNNNLEYLSCSFQIQQVRKCPRSLQLEQTLWTYYIINFNLTVCYLIIGVAANWLKHLFILTKNWVSNITLGEERLLI